jgi:hypothetical protein
MDTTGCLHLAARRPLSDATITARATRTNDLTVRHVPRLRAAGRQALP